MSESIRSKTSAVKSPSDLPPPRDRKGIRSVSPPLSNMTLTRFNYYIVLLGALVMAFYAWRLLQWKSEVGGWWNMVLGKHPLANGGVGAAGARPTVTASASSGGTGTVEDRINELAAALGMPSKDLAMAIADAVREHVPPASLSSVAAHEPSGAAVQYLVNPGAAAAAATEVGEQATYAAASGASMGMAAVVNAVEAAVGLDEPPSEIGSYLEMYQFRARHLRQ